MGRSVPLFLTRIAAIVVAGLLLFAVFGGAHAQDNNQGDDYDSAAVSMATAAVIQ
jgi:hypothetical protein